MSKKIIGATVGTTISPNRIAAKIKPVKTVNNTAPDENGNVNVKTAYEYAKEGGYTGTEAEFAAKLAAEYLTSESDPTVPSWAKQTNKPSYTKNEVGLDHVDNVKQYSASNPPPYPVTSVNGYTGAVSLGMSDLALGHETWTFTLEDGSTVDKLVTLYVSNAAPT